MQFSPHPLSSQPSPLRSNISVPGRRRYIVISTEVCGRLTPYINRHWERSSSWPLKAIACSRRQRQQLGYRGICKLCYYVSSTKFTAMMKRSKTKYCRNFVFCSLLNEYVHGPRFYSSCNNLNQKHSHFYCAMRRAYATVCRRLSVCDSVTFRYRDHIGILRK